MTPEAAGARAAAPRRFAAALLAAALLALAGCSSLGLSEDAPQSQSVPIGLPAPTGDPEHDKILASYGGVYEDDGAAKAVARAVGRLVEASDDPSQSYRITILNSPAINAFALQNGNLYVTRGLLALANDTSELAAVIAHEMAHVTARHAIARARQAEAASVVGRVVSQVGTDSGTRSLALTATQVSFARFSQVQELEADAIGVKTLARAGYDPFGAARFLTNMARFATFRSQRGPGNGGGRADFLSSHPSTPERVTFALRSAREIAAPGLGEQQRDAYLQAIDGLVYGDDPSEGFVRGRAFLHKGLGIQLTAPDGFLLENTSKAVLAMDENGNALRFDGVALPATTKLTDYLGSGWINGLDPNSITETKIGDFPAATATAFADGYAFRIGVIRAQRTTYRFIMAGQTPDRGFETAFIQAMSSFRRLTPAESAKLRPLHLRIQKVRPGDTAERLAETMTGVDRRLDLFRVLNGLEPGDPLEAGRSVKLVTDQ
jgi:predicted Zn-dependent protease